MPDFHASELLMKASRLGDSNIVKWLLTHGIGKASLDPPNVFPGDTQCSSERLSVDDPFPDHDLLLGGIP